MTKMTELPEFVLLLILWWVLMGCIFIWMIYEREYRAAKRNPTSDPVCRYGRAETATTTDGGANVSADVLPTGTPGADLNE